MGTHTFSGCSELKSICVRGIETLQGSLGLETVRTIHHASFPDVCVVDVSFESMFSMQGVLEVVFMPGWVGNHAWVIAFGQLVPAGVLFLSPETTYGEHEYVETIINMTKLIEDRGTYLRVPGSFKPSWSEQYPLNLRSTDLGFGTSADKPIQYTYFGITLQFTNFSIVGGVMTLGEGAQYLVTEDGTTFNVPHGLSLSNCIDTSTYAVVQVHLSNDMVIINDRVYSLDPCRVTASIGGDPYLFPVSGPPVKIPNVFGRYRLLHLCTLGLYCDVIVDKQDIQMPKYPTSLDRWSTVIERGHFITKCLLNSTDGPKLVLDVTNAELFNRNDVPWVTGTAYVGDDCTTYMGNILAGRYVSRTLVLPARVGFLEIRIYSNPQITNALVWTIPTRCEGIGGLLYQNYRPKIFESSTKWLDVPYFEPTGKRLLQSRSIVHHGEVPESVTCPRLFTRMFV